MTTIRGRVRAALVLAPIDGEDWETYSIKGITYVERNIIILDLASPPSPLLKIGPGDPLTREQVRAIKERMSYLLLPEPYA